jgi:hypothetical protein
VFEIPPANFYTANKLLFIGEFFSLTSIWVAKTSFCVTLLRLATHKWHKAFLWFIIITVDIITGMCALIIFTGCTPIDKVFDRNVPGTCWDQIPLFNFTLFVGCKSIHLLLPCSTASNQVFYSMVCLHRLQSRLISLDSCLEIADEASREAWCLHCHEYGSLVSTSSTHCLIGL